MFASSLHSIRRSYSVMLAAGLALSSSVYAGTTTTLSSEIVQETGVEPDGMPDMSGFTGFGPPVLNNHKDVAFLASAAEDGMPPVDGLWFSDKTTSGRKEYKIALEGEDPTGSSFDVITDGIVTGGNSIGQPVLLDGESGVSNDWGIAYIAATTDNGAGGHGLLFADSADISMSAVTSTLIDRSDTSVLALPSEPHMVNYYFSLSDSFTNLNMGCGLSLIREEVFDSPILGWYAKLRQIQGMGDTDRGGMFCANMITLGADDIVRQSEPVDRKFDSMNSVTVGGDSTSDNNLFNSMCMNKGQVAAISVESNVDRDTMSTLSGYKNMIICADQGASTPSPAVIAFEGDAATDSAGDATTDTFINLDYAPVINTANNIAFRADIENSSGDEKNGIWVYDDAKSSMPTPPDPQAVVLRKIVREGDSINSGQEFGRCGDPVINKNSQIAFMAEIKTTAGADDGSGVFLSTTAGIATQFTTKSKIPPLGSSITTIDGDILSFGDPSINDKDVVVVFAEVDIAEQELVDNLDDVPGTVTIEEEAIFVSLKSPQTIAITGATVEDLTGDSDQRVIIGLRMLGDETLINATHVNGQEGTNTLGTLEGLGSGGEDGRRRVITDTEIDGSCESFSVAYAATLYNKNPGPDEEELSEAVFLSTVEVCNTTRGQARTSSETIAEFLSAFGETNAEFDLDNDGIVTAQDLAMLLADIQ